MDSQEIILREYLAVKKACALFDHPDRGIIEVRGEDRTQFLHNVLSNDIKNLTAGKGIAACLLNAQAKIIANMNALCFDDFFWLALDYVLKDKLIQALEKLIITEDVKLRDRSDELKLISIHGPKAKEILTVIASEAKQSPSTEIASSATPPRNDIPDQILNHTKITTNGVPVIIIRINLTGEIGYGLLIPKNQADSIKNWLMEKGTSFGLTQIGAQAMEVLRIEAGIPRYGIDFDESHIPLEAGLEKTVSFTKGCFPGQEILARLDSRGGISKKLMGLEFEGEKIPKKNDQITQDGKTVGYITSAAFSPALKKIVAMGYVKKEGWTSGEIKPTWQFEVQPDEVQR
ncbi:MAG: aminomethyl transferase family protein [Candidatus Omnitrophica bacterium]|nr:aminomethyl transferase family protein [Candidatus Omnitrophota bacterium]